MASANLLADELMWRYLFQSATTLSKWAPRHDGRLDGPRARWCDNGRPVGVIVYVLLSSAVICIAFSRFETVPVVPTTDPVVDVRHPDSETQLVTATFSPRVRLGREIQYEHTFALANTDSEELVVQKIDKSCGCLSGTIDRDIIPAGESASVTMQLRPGELVNKSATLAVNTTSGRRYVYELRTWTYPCVTLDQTGDSPISFGALDVGAHASTTRKLLVYSYAGAVPPELRFMDVEPKCPVTCDLTELGVEPYLEGRLSRRAYHIRVALVADNRPGLHVAELKFDAAQPVANAGAYAFSTRLTWAVRNPIAVDPPRWIVKRSSNPSDKLTLSLMHRGGQSFRLRNVSCSHEWLSAEMPPDRPGEGQNLTLRLALPRVPDEHRLLGIVCIESEWMLDGRSVAGSCEFPVIVID